jgi:hypothetical protein
MSYIVVYAVCSIHTYSISDAMAMCYGTGIFGVIYMWCHSLFNLLPCSCSVRSTVAVPVPLSLVVDDTALIQSHSLVYIYYNNT